MKDEVKSRIYFDNSMERLCCIHWKSELRSGHAIMEQKYDRFHTYKSDFETL